MKYKIFGKNDSYDSEKVEYESTNDVEREVIKKILGRRGLYGKEEIQNFFHLR